MYLTRQEIRQHAGEMIICGFDGTSLTPELKEIIREVNPLGLVLFARNIESPEHVCEFNRELKSYCGPILLCVDQEGGRVARVKSPASVWPPMRALGTLGDVDLVQRVGAALGREMRALNFDVDFAPVLDVDTNPKNPIIGDRAFSRDPQQVGAMGAALIAGLQGAGIAACGKHFPGHGDTDLDSHLALPTVSHELQRMREIEWPPFAAAIAAQVSSIMTAHVVAEEIDASLPATLSSQVLQHLRKTLGFKGVIVSDDIEMKAVADRFSPAEMARLGINAGVDVFLACHKPEVTLALYRGIVVAAEQDEIPQQDMVDAAKRCTDWRKTYSRPAQSSKDMAQVVACGDHQRLVQEIKERLQVGV